MPSSEMGRVGSGGGGEDGGCVGVCEEEGGGGVGVVESLGLALLLTGSLESALILVKRRAPERHQTV